MENNYCKFNKRIDCMECKCNSCGWNPAVAKERIKAWEMKCRLENKNG